MSLRLLTLPFLALLVGTACTSSGKDDETDEPTVGDDDDDDDTADTASGPEPLKVPAYYYPYAEFAWDTDAQTTTSFFVNGTEYASTLYMTIGTQEWLEGSSDEDEFCVVAFDINGLGPADWIGDAGQLAGFDISGRTGVADGCEVFDLTALGGDPVAYLAAKALSLGFGGSVNQELVDQGFFTAEDLEFYTGGYFKVPESSTADTYAYGYGLQVDEDFELVTGDDGYAVPIPVAEMPGGSGLVSGLYIWNTLIAWSVQQ